MKRALQLISIATLAFSLSGCFIVGKSKSGTRSQPSTANEPKNHGQARKEEVHERNDARKAAKDAEKGK